ncbi:MAG: MBL fold metallo-hydrolase [Nitriliruptorales bacterium]|nr:MBL fold metallo-hydrolase [Nitriliruptorales bacterium]
MRLTVLGSSGTHPGPDRLCSSYLVTHEGFQLLMDCGNGSLSNLQRVTNVSALDAVLISHLHPDHFVDLYGLYYALRFHPDGPQRVPLYAPAGAHEFVTRLLSGESAATFARHLPATVLAPGDRISLGPLQVRLFGAEHTIATLAPRVEAGGRVLAYSGDSGRTPALIDCARDADLFVCDSSWLERDRPHPEGVHMTGAEAGRTAQEAGAGRLLLTHIHPRNDPEDTLAEASSVYHGSIMVAHDLDVVELGS